MMRILMVIVALSFFVLEAPCDARSNTQKVVVELGEAYFKRAPPTAFRRTIAVLPIKVPAELERGGVADSVAAFVREKLAMSTLFVLVERANIDAILSEIELGLSGLADPSKIAKAGELLGAELLLQGSLSEAGDALVLSLEIADASTGQIVVSVTRTMDRADLVASGSEYLRSSFQSQYGLSVYGSAGLAWGTSPVWVPNFKSDNDEITHKGPLSFMAETGVSYKLLSWLGLDLGFLILYTPQFYLSDDGKVESPLAVGTRSVRYTEFSGSGLSLGATAIYSLAPRINLGMSARGFMLMAPKLTHRFMDFQNYDIDADGNVSAVNRDIVIVGSKFDPSLGAYGDARFEYLISRRMSIGLEAGYLWMPAFIPDQYMTGNHIQASNTADSFPSYMDKNGSFDFMGGFNVARVDGTAGSHLVSYNPSSLFATLFVAFHF